jgi:hypothetical protein
LSGIEVVQEPGNPDKALTPLSERPSSFEQLVDAPLNKISLPIDCCEAKAANDEYDEEWRYQPPAPVIIEGAQGITLQDFVTQTHAYLSANGEQTFMCEDELYAESGDLNKWREML